MPSANIAPTRVVIVGAGAAGMSAALSLAQDPLKFHVTVWERAPVPGGSAISFDIPEKQRGRLGAAYYNAGVQGGSPAFKNTLNLVNLLGFETQPVKMQISFGKGEDDFWTNVFPTKLTEEFSSDIRKFGRVLKLVSVFESFFAFVSVSAMLRLFRFSKGFGDKMIFPLVALFFGTGNETSHVSTAILARVFNDENMRLFEYSPDSLLASIPMMFAFPRLSELFQAWQKEIERKAGDGNSHFKMGREAIEVVTREKGNVRIKWREEATGFEGEGVFDEVIFAGDADSTLKLLGKQATMMERFVLGSVKYLHDVTITHTDANYMSKHYELSEPTSLANNSPAQDRPTWLPLYFVHTYKEDRSKIEMSFDLSVYQPQFKITKTTSDSPDTISPSSQEELPSDHVYQSLFLDRNHADLWTKDEIDPNKILSEHWWKQQSHRWQHYLRVVPLMWTINGKHYTHYAGAWTILNMHELAITSGFAAAYRLGGRYPFIEDDAARRMFQLYLGASHGHRMRREDRKGFWC